MSLLAKIGFRCAVWMLAFCAVLISPVILIYGPLIAIGVVADVVRGRGILDAAQSAGARDCATGK